MGEEKTLITLDCPGCDVQILTYVTGEVQDYYKIECPKCPEKFTYATKHKNIQCPNCDHIGQYLDDERENYACEKCLQAFTGFVTRNKNSILTAIKNCFESFPPDYNDIKNHGVNFLTTFLEQSTDLNDIHLKSALAEYQKGIYYMVEHLKAKGKKRVK